MTTSDQGSLVPVWGCGHDCRDRDCDGCKVIDWRPGSEEQPELPFEERPNAQDYRNRAERAEQHAAELMAGNMPENPKAIYGRAKPSLALMPSAAMIEAAGVFELGADKYGPFNWRRNPVESMTYANAALRHIFKWIDGQDFDEESGCLELAHAIACLAIVIDARANGALLDDRPINGVAAQLIALKTKTIN